MPGVGELGGERGGERGGDVVGEVGGVGIGASSRIWFPRSRSRAPLRAERAAVDVLAAAAISRTMLPCCSSVILSCSYVTISPPLKCLETVFAAPVAASSKHSLRNAVTSRSRAAKASLPERPVVTFC